MSDRDRDAGGRPRNARPRDALGRPLERGAAGAEPLNEPAALPPREALIEATRLIAIGRPFEAHEVLEAAWKATEGADREFWRGLAQLAVGVTHALRGNDDGRRALLLRASGNLSRYAADPPYDVDASGLAAWAKAAAADQDLAEHPPPILDRQS